MFTPTPPSIFVFLGPPGSGKGTQAKQLSKHLNVPHVSTGDLIRAYAHSDAELSETLNKGLFVSDSLIMKLLDRRIQEPDCQEGFILDGFPRNLAQCKVLDEQFINKAQLTFIEVQLDEETIVQRLGGRRTCSNCSKIYHTLFSPPQKEEECDECHHALFVRPDDQPSVILKRLQIFNQEFEPMLSYYSNRTSWITLCAQASQEECFSNLLAALNEKAPQLLLNSALTR